MEVRSTARGLGLLAGCCLAAAPMQARADVVDAEIWAGGRIISGDTSSSKFNEYRDLEPGGFGGANFLVEDPNGVTFLWGDFDNVGYDNQSYSLEAGQWGRLRLFGEYSELPHIFSNDARTLYSHSGSNLFDFPDALQGAIEAVPTGPTQAATRSALLGFGDGSVVPPIPGLDDAHATALDYQLRTIVGGLIFDPREDLELETAYRQLQRSGRRPFGMGFGSPGGNFANFAAPIDEHTNEVTADVRFGRGPFDLEVGYLGSFFDNELTQITVDNPLQLNDVPTTGLTSTPGRGRISVSPDNTMNNFHATGAYELPLAFPARIATTFSYGLREQDQDFLPHTINSAFAGRSFLVLPENSLDGKVQTYLANVLLTARPLPELDLRARYRYYDFHNDTPVIGFPGHVVNDQTADDEIVRNVPNSYERQQAGFDASYRFSRAVTVRGGPFWDRWSRSHDREVARLDEYGAKLATDLRPTSWALVRADYLFGERNGTQYHPYNHLAASLDPGQLDEEDFSNVGQLAQLRKFDEADRTRNEVKLLTQLIPREDLDLSFSGGWALYDYPNSDFGATKDQRWNLGSELGYQPVEWLSMSAWYSFEHTRLDQESRWRPVGGTPPAVVDSSENDWSSESTDLVHTLGANLDFVIVPDKLDLSFSYTYEHGNGQTHSNGASGCLAPVTATNPTGACLPTAGGVANGGNAVDYPDIEDRLQIFATILRYHVTEHFTLEGMYAFEMLSMQDYRVDGLNPYMPGSNVNNSGVVSPSLDVFLGDQLGGYNANIFALSLNYKF